MPAIVWVLRRRLLGTNVGRWDYLASLIEMWKDDPRGVFPDPQAIGMASPNMIAYQRYNALIMLMAGMKNGELSQGAPIGGMAAVMIYQPAMLTAAPVITRWPCAPWSSTSCGSVCWA